MERLTKKDIPEQTFCQGCVFGDDVNGCEYGGCDRYYSYQEAYHKLQELEDKIEQGQLIELPCRVGDTVYYIEYFCDYKKCTEQSFCCGCKEMLERERTKSTHIICEKKFNLTDFDKIGEEIFLTKEQAEANLKELENE